MLFEGNSLHQLGSGPRFEERKGLLQEVLLDFRAAFPELEFEIHIESATINAQAIIHGEIRIVRITAQVFEGKHCDSLCYRTAH